MRIYIRLYGTLRDLLPPEAKGRTTLQLPAGATAADALAELGIDEPVLIAINETHESTLQQPLQADDQLAVFLPAAGGKENN